MSERQNYFARAKLVIRKPVTEVFRAFIDPAVTTKFWFTHSSGKLEEGKQVEWKWEMYQLTAPIKVRSIVPNEKILFDWGTGKHQSTVEFSFEAKDDDKTRITVINDDFQGDMDDIIEWMRDSTGGFNLVLAAAKAWLEHGIELNVVLDKD